MPPALCSPHGGALAAFSLWQLPSECKAGPPLASAALPVLCATGFMAVQACRSPSRAVDLDPRDGGDTSRHWELVGPRGSQKIRVRRGYLPGARVCAARGTAGARFEVQ